MRVEPIAVAGDPDVRGVLHRASGPDGLVLTHGAGGSMESPLLVAVAAAFAAHGVTVLRCDLPYRQARRTGPPSPAGAARDRDGLRAALRVLGQHVDGRRFLGGHSYGGRMASMVVAAEPSLASGLLLQSYPVHPPGKPAEARTAHLAGVRVPALFVHGTTDPFGTAAEVAAARALIPAPTDVLLVAGGHDLGWGGTQRDPGLPERIARAFLELVASGGRP